MKSLMASAAIALLFFIEAPANAQTLTLHCEMAGYEEVTSSSYQTKKNQLGETLLWAIEIKDNNDTVYYRTDRPITELMIVRSYKLTQTDQLLILTDPKNSGNHWTINRITGSAEHITHISWYKGDRSRFHTTGSCKKINQQRKF